jgi:hypothetical protein
MNDDPGIEGDGKLYYPDIHEDVDQTLNSWDLRQLQAYKDELGMLYTQRSVRDPIC